MKHSSFVDSLSRRSGHAADFVQKAIDAISSILEETSLELNSVAIPGFGTFQSTKHDEHIERDTSDGTLKLYPPKVELSFTASTKLKKQLVP